MSIQTQKQTMGFLAANDRPCCGNCRHAKEDIADRAPPWDTSTWHCKKGSFRTTAKAVCNNHQSRQGNGGIAAFTVDQLDAAVKSSDAWPGIVSCDQATAAATHTVRVAIKTLAFATLGRRTAVDLGNGSELVCFVRKAQGQGGANG